MYWVVLSPGEDLLGNTDVTYILLYHQLTNEKLKFDSPLGVLFRASETIDVCLLELSNEQTLQHYGNICFPLNFNGIADIAIRLHPSQNKKAFDLTKDSHGGWKEGKRSWRVISSNDANSDFVVLVRCWRIPAGVNNCFRKTTAVQVEKSGQCDAVGKCILVRYKWDNNVPEAVSTTTKVYTPRSITNYITSLFSVDLVTSKPTPFEAVLLARSFVSDHDATVNANYSPSGKRQILNCSRNACQKSCGVSETTFVSTHPDVIPRKFVTAHGVESVNFIIVTNWQIRLLASIANKGK